MSNKSWLHYHEECLSLIRASSFDRALLLAKEGRAQHPSSIHLTCLAITACRAEGDFVSSLQYSQSLIASHPSNWQGYAKYSEDLNSLGRYDEALLILEQGIVATKENPHLCSAAIAICRLREDREAVTKYLSLLTSSPDLNEHDLYSASIGYLFLGNIDESRRLQKAGLLLNSSSQRLASLNNQIITHEQSLILSSVPFDQLSTAYLRAACGRALQMCDRIISIGPSCRNTHHIRRLTNNDGAYPFDWWITPYFSMVNIFKNWNEFCIKEQALMLTPSGKAVLNTDWSILHVHDFPKSKSGVIRLDRDSSSLKNIITELNSKYLFLFQRMFADIAEASSPLLVLGGYMAKSFVEVLPKPENYCSPPIDPSDDDFLIFLDYVRSNLNSRANMLVLSFGNLPALEKNDSGLIKLTVPDSENNLAIDNIHKPRSYLGYDLAFTMLASVL